MSPVWYSKVHYGEIQKRKETRMSTLNAQIFSALAFASLMMSVLLLVTVVQNNYPDDDD